MQARCARRVTRWARTPASRPERARLARRALTRRANRDTRAAPNTKTCSHDLDALTPGTGTQRPWRFCFEACCLDPVVSVTSDAEVMVPTGGELTLFEAVGRVA